MIEEGAGALKTGDVGLGCIDRRLLISIAVHIGIKMRTVDSLKILPQTSSSQPALLSMTVSALTVAVVGPVTGAPLALPTRLSKSTAAAPFTPVVPVGAVPERSSKRCESLKN